MFRRAVYCTDVGDCLGVGRRVVKSRIPVGDCLDIGERVMKSRISAGDYHRDADLAMFSRFRLQGRFFRIADFQRFCWEIIRRRLFFPQSPMSDVGERTRIRRIRHFYRNHRAREDPSSRRSHANRLRHTPATSGIVESAAHRAEACTGMREGIHARHARAVKQSSRRAEHSPRRIGAFGLFGCVATPVPPRIRPRVLRAA